MVFLVLHTTHNSQQSLLLVVIFLLPCTRPPIPFTRAFGLRSPLALCLLPYAIIRAESLCAISKMTCAVNEGMEIANYLLTTRFLCYKKNNDF